MALTATLQAKVPQTTDGLVKSIAIDEQDGLVFELKGAANRNKAFTVDTDDSHYSGSVSLVLMAHSQRERVVVRHSALGRATAILAGAGSSSPSRYHAMAVGFGVDPEVD